MKRYMYWLLPISWMAVLFYSSSTPYEQQNMKPFLSSYVDLSFLEPYVGWVEFTYHRSVVSVAELGIEGFVEFFVRKGAHVVSFYMLCCFFYIALRNQQKVLRRMSLAFLLTVVYATLDELHQGITPNRTPYVGDVLLDSFGALLAIICIVIFAQFDKKRLIFKES
ncbi:VanZ family protein [Pontibacillus litoralis]|uniref:VanZ-like domain-containing protein n=1 Tax=Pontibacillus litoralis JSM 072002 TaxID=1385512 RepID=A0A0A5FZR8_9BACI|nr:VanZ family protein [Pontibacillus litoralis]KGX86326.1 hypothetical protein N784_05090 [Pontibacillus litoralis JSM 072002]